MYFLLLTYKVNKNQENKKQVEKYFTCCLCESKTVKPENRAKPARNPFVTGACVEAPKCYVLRMAGFKPVLPFAHRCF